MSCVGGMGAAGAPGPADAARHLSPAPAMLDRPTVPSGEIRRAVTGLTIAPVPPRARGATRPARRARDAVGLVVRCGGAAGGPAPRQAGGQGALGPPAARRP